MPPQVATGRKEWTASSWGRAANQALETIQDLGWRLAEPTLVERAAEQAQRESAFPRTTHWRPYTVAQGYAGLALLCAQLDKCFPQEGWDEIGREHLTRAARDAEKQQVPSLGLFSGLAGLAFAAWELSREETRYARLLRTLDETLLSRATRAAEYLRAAPAVSVSQFDVISGLSGIAAYLLKRACGPRHAECRRDILTALVELLAPQTGLPRWYTPPGELYDDRTRAVYPFGNLNCGLAHGVPGPLALLSIAYANGVKVNGMEAAIARTADWLCAARWDDEWGINWPTAIAVQPASNGDLAIVERRPGPDGPSRSAWCYGAPGVARALWLAGEALDCAAYRNIAIDAMRAVFRRPVHVRRIDSPSFCHGVAGLLQIALRFRNDSDDEVFEEGCRELVEQILRHYQPQSLLGFRHIENGGREIDQPGLLDGTPGIALVLLASSTSVAPDWDRLFLLS